MKTNIIWIIVVAVVFIGGYTLFNSGTQTENMKNTTVGEEMGMHEENDMADMEEDKVMKNDMDEGMSMDKTGSYETYSAEKLSMVDSGDVVLFFKASWCPSCRALDNDIKASLEDIPSGVTILEVNYDTATDLKKKYGVTTQHTLVQVDSDGNMLEKWTGSSNLEQVITKLK